MVGYTDGDVAIVDHVKQLTELSPMRPHYHFIILCCKGKAQLSVNGKCLQILQDEVLVSSPHVILDNFLFSPDFECKILCLSDRIIQGLLGKETDIWNRALYVYRLNIVRLPEEDVMQFGLYYALICQKINMEERRFAKETMQTLIKSLLLDLCAILDARLRNPRSEKPTLSRLLFDRFLSMLSAETVKRRPVGYYASQLAVTPKYLTTICESYSNKPASEWINQYVVEDVRYALRNTAMPMKEIADRLGFANTSHFGTYVRRFFGMSPTAYRSSGNERRDGRL